MQTAKTSNLITEIDFWSILNYNGIKSIKRATLLFDDITVIKMHSTIPIH